MWVLFLATPDGFIDEILVFDPYYYYLILIDEDTVGNVISSVSMFVGRRVPPHTPTLGKAASPNPTMSCGVEVLDGQWSDLRRWGDRP